MFSCYKYLIVSLVFSHLGFWCGSLFLIAPFPDLCLLVLFDIKDLKINVKALNQCHFSVCFIMSCRFLEKNVFLGEASLTKKLMMKTKC